MAALRSKAAATPLRSRAQLRFSAANRLPPAVRARHDDEDARVRDWATFGLARQTDEDFPLRRDALADRLHDDDLDTRLEAVHGLTTRGDERVMRPLLDILESPPESSDPGLVSEALCALATTTVDPRLSSHLLAERDCFLADPIDEWPDGRPGS